MSENQEVELTLENGQESFQLDEFMYEPIDLNIESVIGLSYDEKEFQRGIKEVSKVCGKISALKSVGLPWNLIMDYIFGEMNFEAIKVNAQTTVDVSKNQLINVEKNTI